MTGTGKKRLEQLNAFLKRRTWIFPLAFCVFSFLFFLPFLFAVDMPQLDVLSRYVPMAEAFAEGDWTYAFHPRIPPFLPLLGGVFIFLTGCNGFFGVKLASLLCFSLTFLPLFPLMRRVFSLRVAITACLLAMLSSHVLRLAFSGLRETAKGLFIIWAAYALVRLWQERKSLKASLMLAFVCAGMVYVRDDSVLYALLFLFAGCGIELFRTRRFPVASLILAPVTAFVLILPLLTLNYRISGYPVPSARFIRFVRGRLPFRMFTPENEWSKDLMVATPDYADYARPSLSTASDSGSASGAGRVVVQAPRAVVSPDEASAERLREDLPAFFSFSWKSFSAMVWDFFRGQYLYYLIPALAMIVLRIRRKKWTTEETILLLVPLLHGFLLVLQNAIANGWFLHVRRYYLPVSPLICGWTALALLFLYDKTRQAAEKAGKPELLSFHSCVSALLFAVLAGALLFDSLAPEVRKFTSKKQRTEYRLLLDWREKILLDYHGPARCTGAFYDEECYRTYKRPRICSESFQKLGALTGGENIEPRFNPLDKRHPVERIPEFLAIQKRQGFPVDYLAEELPGGEETAVPCFEGYEIFDRKLKGGRRFLLWKRIETSERERSGNK